ncbi:unnamed protein product [Periconia digitata]|uniref:Uncharacterized protein n=1 Tax=Periconia digitata TaxID=1303443 RepID=A0A9W4UTD9_9PLEO|nr:unnamed protein product [Periconia digitata]
MPGLLGRSKSLRLLRKGGHDGPHSRETDRITPQFSRSQVDVRRLKEASFPTSGGTVETPDMMQQRPQTSGGPGDRTAPPFHKKVRPLQPQPDNSFDFAPPLSPAKPNALLYTAEVYESTEGIIGIALGSPTMASHWNVSSPAPDFVTDTRGPVTHISSDHQPTSQPSEAGTAQPQPDTMARPKLSRWKSLFKKTAPPPRLQEKEAFYKLASSMPPARADSPQDEEPPKEEPNVQSPASYSYNPSIRESRKLPKGQPQPVADTRPRALTLTTGPPKPKTSLLRSASNAISPRFPKKSPLPQVTVSNDPSPAPVSGKPAERPVLDVAIPEVRMERYSVMFSSLLQQNQDSDSSSNPTFTLSSPVQKPQESSLLQRRQAEQLKPLDRLSIKSSSQNSGLKPQRRATSPGHHAKSPSASLSLFPSPNTSRAPSPRSLHTSVHRPRPLQRSRTNPASTASPQDLTFPSSQNEETRIGLAITPGTPSQELTPMTSTSVMTTTPSSRNSFESDRGADEEIITVRRPAAKRPITYNPIDDKEPEWDIIVPQQRAAPESQFQSQKISKADALRSHPSVRRPGDASSPSSSTSPSSAPAPAPVREEDPQHHHHPPSSAPLEKSIIATASPITLIRSPSSARTQTITRSASTAKSSSSSSRSAGATVGVARSISVSRARSPMLATPGSAGSKAVSVASPNAIGGVDAARLGDGRALTPTLVELKNRRSQRVMVVDA